MSGDCFIRQYPAISRYLVRVGISNFYQYLPCPAVCCSFLLLSHYQ